MTKRAVPWISLALCALLLAGCGAEGASADASDGNPTATTASTAPATTTTTVPPPYSFDGSVPPPPLVNTGTDYEAIIRSLDNYSHWLYAHNPDSALVDELVVVGTPLHDSYVRDLQLLSRDHVRGYDTASQIRRVSVSSEMVGATSLTVDYQDDKRVLVTKDGAIADETRLPRSSIWTYLLTTDATGRWRIASADVLPKDTPAP